jgi:pimeloyl-ACP methyl ester carboxylesterase
MKRIFSVPTIGLILVFLFAAKVSSAQSLFTVEVTGKGKPMILIHGLYCSGDVWKETVAHYKDKYECHVITLAGFAGNAPNLRENFLAGVKDEVIAYTKSKKLNKPVLMGHSMGGFLSLWASLSAPGLFEKVIVVDANAYLAALQMPGATTESSKPMAIQMRDMTAKLTPEQTAQNQSMYLPTMITSPERIAQVSDMAVKSDNKTQGQVLYELYTVDLRKDVATIDCPVLILGAWIAYKNYGVTREMVMKSHTDQAALIKNVKIELNDTAKHFIFYDDEPWFFEKVDAFLK